MRAYVITLTDHILEHKFVSGVVSNRKSAINACEKTLEAHTATDDDVVESSLKWQERGKHEGCATMGDYVARYEMFFINQLDLENT